MKKVIYILACVVSLSSCTQTETKTTLPTQEENIAEYALPLDTAIAFTRRYNNLALRVLGDSAPIKSYTIRAIDLLEAMGMPLAYADSAAYDHVRVYIGVDSRNKFRLLLTPVDGAVISKGISGEDKILEGLFTSGLRSSTDNPLSGQYVMDFTGPCPNSCATSSPLYK